MFAFLPNTAKTVLDVGCAQGAFGLAIKIKSKIKLGELKLTEKVSEKVKKVLDKLFIGPYEDI